MRYVLLAVWCLSLWGAFHWGGARGWERGYGDGKEVSARMLRTVVHQDAEAKACSMCTRLNEMFAYLEQPVKP